MEKLLTESPVTQTNLEGEVSVGSEVGDSVINSSPSLKALRDYFAEWGPKDPTLREVA